MAVFDEIEFDQHESVVFANDRGSGLRAIVALHDTRRGPALGGCRMYPYPSSDAALRDVLRLSRGMTYKNAIAGLPVGGGKAVIIGDPRVVKTERLLEAFANVVNQLSGRYITAADLGMTMMDLKVVARHCPYVTGISDHIDQGDSGPQTALGVYHGMRAAVEVGLGRMDFEGLTVAIQGLGSVGFPLAERLHAEGADLIVADIDPELTAALARRCGARARVASTEEILNVSADVLCPCALGGILNERVISRLDVKVVCGCANNQLATRVDGDRLQERGILYAPDFVVNAGGVISVAAEYRALSIGTSVQKRIERIYETTLRLLQRSIRENRAPGDVADSMAREILQEARMSLPPTHTSDYKPAAERRLAPSVD